jgi:predicted dehydrogenase/threonine dehydrogenase-like Zn-dependent dehydrogenase
MQAVLRELRTGEVNTYDVPEPELRSHGILVRTAFSAISSGTERATLEASEKSIFATAMARPDIVKRLWDVARTDGVKAAYDQVQARLDRLSPLGYSCSGIVIGVGEGVTEFQCGDRVACGGSGHANHCEVNWIPRNLAARVPDLVSLDAAALTTVGAIAMQGLRQAQVSFGETVVVIGAGLVGVLTMQLARAAGCRVMAVDLDPSRVEEATSLGAHLALLSSDARLLQAAREFSRYGADAAVVTAATRSVEPLELAGKLLRDRGRIVVVGDVGMGVSRHNLYHKELTLAMSRSYGPGRYDPTYEQDGHDYPVGYVRWTEGRNMEAFLDFLASRSINIVPLLQQRYQVSEAARAYHDLGTGKAYTAILEYPAVPQEKASKTHPKTKSSKSQRTGILRVGCIGAGGFARNTIFPNLKVDGVVSLEAVATVSGVSAESARRSVGFARALTPGELLRDPGIDAVFIASRHQSHSEYVVAALRHGKPVFVEKPLAINREQLNAIRQSYGEAAESEFAPFLMLGFNRRFASFTQEICSFFAGRREPMMVHARINAGFVPREHWTQQASEGGRIVGEFCHFVDWARCVVGVPIHKVTAAALSDGSRYNHDNVAATLKFEDGSIANLLYLANGDPTVPKEFFEVFCEGRVARLDNFEILQLIRDQKVTRLKSTLDKGHRRELQLTLSSMATGGESPIPFETIIEVMEATFAVAEAVAPGRPVPPNDLDLPLLHAGK